MSSTRHMDGPRPQRRWPAVVLAGVAVGTVVCGTTVVVMLNRGVTPGARPEAASQEPVDDSPTAAGAERRAVPDACVLVSDKVARRLVPKADRTQTDTFTVTDTHNQCVWSRFGDRQRRQLTVELRAVSAIGERSATEVAGDVLKSERTADEAGRGLPERQKVCVKRRVEGVGEEGYLTYSIQHVQRFGEAMINVRLVNMLITVHYGGRDSATVPLSSKRAIDGALQATAATIAALGDR